MKNIFLVFLILPLVFSCKMSLSQKESISVQHGNLSAVFDYSGTPHKIRGSLVNIFDTIADSCFTVEKTENTNYPVNMTGTFTIGFSTLQYVDHIQIQAHSLAILYDEAANDYISQNHNLTLIAVKDDTTETKIFEIVFQTGSVVFDQNISVNDTIKNIKIIWHAESTASMNQYSCSLYDVKLYKTSNDSNRIL